jgi:predicted Na+-dependent transporter
LKETIILTLKIIAPIAVALIVFAQGLKVSPSEVIVYFKERPWLILRSLIAVLVLVPAAALVIILLLKPAQEVAVGLAITIAASNFTPPKALPVLVPCVFVFIAVAMVYLLWRKKALAGGDATPSVP